MRQFATLKKEHVSEAALADMAAVCAGLGVEGTEVYMDDILSRSELLYTDEAGKEEWLRELTKLCVKRVHCSYWAYPTSFLTKHSFTELTERFGSLEAVREYYGDLTGAHMFRRWAQEYALATALGAQSYTYHLIDYAPIDGMWDFSISRADIRQAMVYMIQHFLNYLADEGLLTENSPQIELENAGFGLEYGLQTAEDFAFLFEQLYDPMGKVKLGWDINHLLHAIGFDRKTGRAAFFLTEGEISPAMRALEEKYGAEPAVFAEEWLRHNLLHPATAARIGGVQLSDCALKETCYFRNGRFIEPYYSEIAALASWEEKEDYGVRVVLGEYDSHVVLGGGILRPERALALLREAAEQSPDMALLHELKNSPDMVAAVGEQIKRLCI